MWTMMGDGSAINSETGDEMYMDLGSDGLIRVYLNSKPIATFRSILDAKEFIEKRSAESE